MTTATPEQAQQIELLIDALGVMGVVEAMGAVCLLKAEYARDTMKDGELYNDWLMTARGLATVYN